MQVALLRNEVGRLKDELAERKNVEEAGKQKENDEKTESVVNLSEGGVVEENLKVTKVEGGKPGNLEMVGEFSIEVSSDEETKESDEEKLVIDETQKCEEEVGKKKTSSKPESKATPLRKKTPVKKAIALKKKQSPEGKGVKENASIDGEVIDGKKVVSSKVQRQVPKDKGKAKECFGPFQCSMDECKDYWVKVPGWERKVKNLD